MRGWRGTPAVLLLPILAATCVSFTQGIGAGQSVNPAHAYLYGRFMVDRAGGGRSLGVALVLGCADGRQYTIGMEQRNEIQVIEIVPARCSLDEILFVNGSEKRGHAYPAPPMNRSIDYLPGTAYYLGDFALRTGVDTNMVFITTQTKLTWDFMPLDGRYPTTTAEMRRQFPNLASFQTEDGQLAPRRTLTPGDEGTKPDGPPLSPERVATLAPFIKHVYPTPAACAGSCGRGQCLPFRGESGPAMACVTRCNKDADCPEDLACNCPNAEKPPGACQPIATTPTDAMAGICLSPIR